LEASEVLQTIISIEMAASTPAAMGAHGQSSAAALRLAIRMTACFGYMIDIGAACS